MKQINQNIVGLGLRYKDDNSLAGYATGVINDGWLDLVVISGTEFNEGSVDANAVYVDPKTSIPNASGAQSELNSLINFNKQILENNLLSVAALTICDARGVVVPAQFRKDLFVLQNRLSARNEQIKKTNVIRNTSEGTSPDMSVYNDKLLAYMQSPGIGSITIGTVLIISAVVALVSAGLAYALFKKLNAEAKADFKYSADLTADLIKFLPGPVYDQLMKENKANEDKANNAINNASGKSFFTTAKYLAVGFLGFWAIDKFLNTRK